LIDLKFLNLYSSLKLIKNCFPELVEGIILKIIIMALAITDATFDEVVLKSDKPVMVDFWAAWCGPCRMVGPIIDELSSEYEGKVVVGKVDVDANQEFAAKYGVRNIPTVLVFHNGEVVGKQVGVAPKQTYADSLDALL
jgi:thioredoxin 1